MNKENVDLDSLNLQNTITIGQGVTFAGSIAARGKVFIYGRVTGEIFVDELQVGQAGVIKGKIRSREIDVYGEIHDDVSCAEHVLVHSTGLIKGKLIYGELEIQKGGRLIGSMDQSHK